ncbi:MAG TPA: hypothetical protein VGC83_19215, partial [Solirubrobacteraceae bacterium]
MPRRRRRSMFSSAPPRRSGVAWLEPGRRRRRGRDGVPWRALLVVIVVLAAAAGAVWFVLDRHHQQDMRREAAQSFAASWMRRDPAGMWLMLDKRSRSAYPRARFARLVRSAESQATVTSVRIGRIAQERNGRFDLPTVMPTRLFGTLHGTIALTVHDEDGAARVAWAPHLRLPGL